MPHHTLQLRHLLLVDLHHLLTLKHLGPMFQKLPSPIGERHRAYTVGPGHLGLPTFPFGLNGLQHHLELERRTVPGSVGLHPAPPCVLPPTLSTPDGSVLGAHLCFSERVRDHANTLYRDEGAP